LIVSARNKSIPTFYLEHGAAGSPETAKARWKETTLRQHKIPYYIERFTKKFRDVIKAKAFYFAVIKGFRSGETYRKFLSLPLKMLLEAPNKVLTYNRFPERVPHKCIVFNKVNYEEFELYTGVSEKDSVLTGVPFFDKYFRPLPQEKEYVVYIDHPYYEENLIGWNKEHHDKISDLLFRFANKTKIRLYIKLHPRSDKSLWENGRYHKDYVTIIQQGDYTDLFLEAKLILGFSSSLITGFLCAKKNIVFLGWHPEPQIFGYDFSKTSLCHFSMNPHELLSKYEYWSSHNLTKENEEAYQAFLHKFNYPFDGKATQRVIDAIIKNENP
jgi:CDP-glycerol glycerophosphotransferase (TagB/SpsB family)